VITASGWTQLKLGRDKDQHSSRGQVLQRTRHRFPLRHYYIPDRTVGHSNPVEGSFAGIPVGSSLLAEVHIVAGLEDSTLVVEGWSSRYKVDRYRQLLVGGIGNMSLEVGFGLGCRHPYLDGQQRDRLEVGPEREIMSQSVMSIGSQGTHVIFVRHGEVVCRQRGIRRMGAAVSRELVYIQEVTPRSDVVGNTVYVSAMGLVLCTMVTRFSDTPLLVPSMV
jgi:hypothetical protein